jgi:hypothetical protein
MEAEQSYPIVCRNLSRTSSFVKTIMKNSVNIKDNGNCYICQIHDL